MRGDLMKKECRINARIPVMLKKCLDEFLALRGYMNVSEFIRDAMREKINREAPVLYRRLFEGNKNER